MGPGARPSIGFTRGWGPVPPQIQRRNLVEIHVDFANRFWLDPTGEIRLNSIGEIRLNSVGEIWLKYV